MQSTEIKTETPKLKIKTTITEKRQIDIEVDSPYYCKYSDGHFLRVEQDYTLSVKTYQHNTGIDRGHTEHWSGVIPSCTECTEEEFNQAYETALTKIQNLPL